MRIEYWNGYQMYEYSCKPEYQYLSQCFKYLLPSWKDYLDYIVLRTNEDIVVGILGYTVLQTFGLFFISVHPKYKRRGISKELLRKFFEKYEKYKHVVPMYISHYSDEDGVKYVYPQIIKLAKEFQIEPLNMHQSHCKKGE